MSVSEPRIVILNQYYVPDVASTGQLLHELAVSLAGRGRRVKVVTSHPSYGPRETWVEAPSREIRDGVEVRRIYTTRFSKDRAAGRILNYATFVLQLGLRMLLTSRRGTVYLYTSNPPFLGFIGAVVSLFRPHDYVVLLHDLYPQLAVWVGKIRKGGVIERACHWMNRMTYRRARQTIVLCEAAKRLVCENYGVSADRVHVIPNWADGDLVRPRPKQETEFARAHGLIEPFTVMYSGNLGLYYEFETILRAAELLREEPFRFVFIGSGGRRAWLAEQIARRGLSRCSLHPYQPLERIGDSLNACDAALVTIARGIEGISYPSKLYSSLATGKPIIALSEPDSELRQLVEEHGVGMWFEVGDAEGMARGLRRLRNEPALAARMGRAARELFESRFTLEVTGEAYAQVLSRACGGGRDSSAYSAGGEASVERPAEAVGGRGVR